MTCLYLHLRTYYSSAIIKSSSLPHWKNRDWAPKDFGFCLQQKWQLYHNTNEKMPFYCHIIFILILTGFWVSVNDQKCHWRCIFKIFSNVFKKAVLKMKSKLHCYFVVFLHIFLIILWLVRLKSHQWVQRLWYCVSKYFSFKGT